MRIIGGKWKRLVLLSPPDGAGIRPTADRVRESVLQMLEPELQGARVLDLFAGTGALGWEALSRGASWVSFVDKSPLACKLIKENATRLKADPQSYEVILSSAVAFARLKSGYHIVFVDPPYAGPDSWWEPWKNNPGLSCAGGLVIRERDKRYEDEDPPLGWELEDLRKYGHTAVEFWRVP